ncbi:dTDP-4-dehydrorhamnose reductase [Ferrovibrio sp. MS7]|uniref:dTDP-4-dehydrorhamnose reductase n=1 Tax=Ferrovibrio plantarum TaxID=3119164 RepID=UPI0031361143
MADILVTGALGQVGQELQRHAVGRDAVFVDRAALDITDAAAVARCVAELKPRVVINAAAYTAVDKAETERELAFAVNGEAPGHLALACAETGAALLHLSTDYVFDGSGTKAWREDDPVMPLSVYGASKLAGEQAVRAALPRHLILRTAWVVSPFRSNFVKTMLRLAAERDELRVVADQFGGPTMAADIAAACWRLADRIATSHDPAQFGIFHFAGQPHVSWHDFACAIIAESARHGGRQPKVTAITSAEYPLPAPRPANSRLDGAKLERVHGISVPDWRRSLATLVDELYASS